MPAHALTQKKDWWVLTDEDFPDHKNNFFFQALPTELLVDIYSRIGPIFTVFKLAATCRRLRFVWIENTDCIYNAIAPVEIDTTATHAVYWRIKGARLLTLQSQSGMSTV